MKDISAEDLCLVAFACLYDEHAGGRTATSETLRQIKIERKIASQEVGRKAWVKGNNARDKHGQQKSIPTDTPSVRMLEPEDHAPSTPKPF